MKAMEQKTEFVEAITDLVTAVQPDFVGRSEPNMNFWPLLFIAVIPVVLGFWLNKRRKKK